MKVHVEAIAGLVKRVVYTTLGFTAYHALPRKKIVVVLSSMRSGSTLLKTLLGQADDISLMDEFHFVPYARSNRYFFYYLVFRQSNKPIIVLKKPYNNVAEQLPDYGVVPAEDALFLILFRGPYETLLSLKTLQKRKGYRVFSDQECVDYWCDTYEAIFDNVALSERSLMVSYEDLTGNPECETKEMFSFIGSRSQAGVEGYGEYEWKHGRDDDSDKIKSRKVHRAVPAGPEVDPTLYQAIQDSKRVSAIYGRLQDKYSHQKSQAGTRNVNVPPGKTGVV